MFGCINLIVQFLVHFRIASFFSLITKIFIISLEQQAIANNKKSYSSFFFEKFLYEDNLQELVFSLRFSFSPFLSVISSFPEVIAGKNNATIK